MHQVINFGEDLTVACTRPMNMSELENICTAQVHQHLYKDKDILLPHWLFQDLDAVGMFGNADPSDLSQWILISKNEDYGAKSRSWNPAVNRCIGLITGLKYRILWTFVGSVANPQAKVVRILLEYEDSVQLTHRIDPKQSQPYTFTTTVTWVFVGDEKADLVKLPPPTLFFRIPDDFFYPFQFTSSGHALQNGRCLFMIGVSTMFVLTLAL